MMLPSIEPYSSIISNFMELLSHPNMHKISSLYAQYASL
jgi:hypothetical protein